MSEVIPVRVAVRIRPLSNKENNEGCQSVVRVINGRPQVYISSLDKAFTYDFAFDANAAQDMVYDSSVKGMIKNLFEGYNATVLAYGQTGSGKTHSMGTTYDPEHSQNQLGIIPRVVQDIFDKIHSMENGVKVQVSFMELYREQLYDLLSSSNKKKEDCSCELREDPQLGVIIQNMTEISVNSLEETMNQLKLGSHKRVTAATAMNNTSSRSHAIFTVKLTMTGNGESNNGTVSKFHLVDLAGSERAKKTKAEGARQKEGIAINQGLLALGNVISALGDESTSGKPNHIPYRNSKLTRLLQDSLGGNSYTLMISCVSPADTNVEETLSTLRYSDRARKIKNKPIVNVDSNDEEIKRLRLEIRELQSLLRQENAGNILFTKEESSEIQDANKRLREENKELTNALMGCQEELTHMNEKVIMFENSNNKIKEALKEITHQGKEFTTDIILQKLTELSDIYNEAEKTIVDHEMSRIKSDDDNETLDDDIDDDEGFVAAHALRNNALAKQLNNLNKVLAHKETVASTMIDNEKKFQELKSTYEKTLNNLEYERSALQKERDELMQQNKNSHHDPSNKLSEQRRKKINELEIKLQELSKKVTEQQRALKLNEKNATQIKKMNEEIMQMKQSKVKLIRQMKEEAEKLRDYKKQKEKEVMKLKQVERKQQVKMAKMEALHMKQQNVLRRKMEEAMNANKRLKDVLDKQKASKSKITKSGMAGAGERMRNFVNEELDVEVSVREAVKSREQLLKDRKTLTKELNELKKNMRGTMTSDEMNENQKKMNEIQGELDLQNAQITQLQKQITDLEQDDTSKDRFENIKTITEFKIALQHAFEKTVEKTMYNTLLKSELDELLKLYNESIKNTNTLEKEISEMKDEHQRNLLKNTSHYEERVLFLLGKLNGQKEVKDHELNRIQELEINKFSKLHDELAKIMEENESLRQKMRQSIENPSDKEETKKPKSRISKEPEERYTEEEFFNSSMEQDENEDDISDVDNDPDWTKTPLYNRMKKFRESSVFMGKNKRNNSSHDDSNIPNKRQSVASTCKCKSDCTTRRCMCKKNGPFCSSECKCDETICRNREGIQNKSNNDDTSDTLTLLNDTYNTSILPPTYLSTENISPQNQRKSFFASPIQDHAKKLEFKSPLKESNHEENLRPEDKFTSPRPLKPKTSFFKSPIIE